MSNATGQSDTVWESRSGHDKVESGLVAGYVVIALIGVINGARPKLGGVLAATVPENPSTAPHTFVASFLDLFRNGTDFVAAVGLLLMAGLILFRRRRSRLQRCIEDPPAQQRFELPFLF
jgi:MYXO-CTERM domain-containing protein